MGILKQGQVIVREGDPVTTDSMKLIEILNRYTSKISIRYMSGVFLIQLIFFFLFILFLRDTHLMLFESRKTVLVSALLLIIYFTYTFVLYRTVGQSIQSHFFVLYLPITFVIMTITILFSTPVAMICALYIIFYTVTITSGDFVSLTIAFCTSFISIFSVTAIEKTI
jgi:membrane-associated HD superfamily phosphohydrolase